MITDDDDEIEIDGETQTRLLAQALPYMQAYAGKTVVIKYGGHAMVDAKLGKAFTSDVALLRQSGVEPIVVHGGGPQIGAMLERMGIKSEFKGGMRVTDRATVEIVEMVLAGSINKSIVADFNAQGARAIGLCGKDGNMVRAVKMRRTLELLQKEAPWLEVDGEMHGDIALDAAARLQRMPNSTLQGEANLLVLPNIDAANIAYNLLKTAAGGNIAIGPVLLGAAKPVQILTASATVRRIVNMTALTVVGAAAQRGEQKPLI